MMRRTGRLLGALILGVCILITPQLKRTHAQSSNYTFTPVIQVGNPPPGQEEYRFSRFGVSRVNNQSCSRLCYRMGRRRPPCFWLSPSVRRNHRWNLSFAFAAIHSRITK